MTVTSHRVVALTPTLAAAGAGRRPPAVAVPVGLCSVGRGQDQVATV